MILPYIPIAAVPTAAAYLCYFRFSMGRRNLQSWDSLISKLQPGWTARELSSSFPWKEGLNATPEETWEHIQGVQGLWAMYKNAKVMLEMADFAVRNSSAVDPVLIQTLRSDATQIRLCVLNAVFQNMVSNAGDGVRVNAFRAASMYTGMAARMTCLLQANAESALPHFVAAM